MQSNTNTRTKKKYIKRWHHIDKQGQRGGARNFCLGGSSATLIHLLRQLPHTYIYTYARFFIIYTHFLFDKLYIYTHNQKIKIKEFSIFNQNYF